MLKKEEVGKPVLKMGPATGKGGVTMEQINKEVSDMDPSQFIMARPDGAPSTLPQQR